LSFLDVLARAWRNTKVSVDGHSDAISWFVNYAEKKEALKKEKQERQRLELDRKNKTQHNQDQNTDQMIFDDSAISFVRPYEHQDTNATLRMQEEERKMVLGYGMTKQEFVDWIKAQDPQAANQTVVARLISVLADTSNESGMT
jgi:hypothetical protein